MSKDIYNRVCRCKLPATAKAIAKELAWFADDAGENAFPSISTIASRTGYTRRATQLNLRKLEKWKLVQGATRTGSSSVYRLLMDCSQCRAPHCACAQEGGPNALGQANGAAGGGECHSPHEANDAVRRGECHSPHGANGAADRGERGSPEKYEQDNGTENHHAYDVMTNHLTRAALQTWLCCKERLRRCIPVEEWNLWVRPAYLCKLMGQDHLLIALPPCKRVITGARSREAMLRRMLSGKGYTMSYTQYPTEDDKERLREAFREFYGGMLGQGTSERVPPARNARAAASR